MGKYTYIYNDHLAYYLSKQGHRFITHARHITTNKEFYQYESTQQLSIDIEKYSQFKLNK